MKRTENDYVAEFIREKHPELLGLDYALWKLPRVLADTIKEVADDISKAVKAVKALPKITPKEAPEDIPDEYEEMLDYITRETAEEEE